LSLSIDKELNYFRSLPGFGSYLAAALSRLQDGVNGLGNHLAADPTGIKDAPPTIQALTVKANGTGLVHAVITDNNPIQKGAHYFVEYANEPNFLQPHVVHLGVSRSMNPVTLPAQDDNGNAQSFYFRAYSQYPGGHPGKAIFFGGSVATKVNPGGTNKLTLLPSTGSGTGAPSGQEGGSGFGKVLYRAAPAQVTVKKK
jgi:hypothetical protein